MLSREEILTVYEAGPEAVVALVQSLCARVEQAEAEVRALHERVRELEVRLGKDSHNSHRPPSSDGPPFRRQRRKSLRHKSGKSPGGQPGHAGHTLLQVEQPNEVIPHVPACCMHCGHDLHEVVASSLQRRQVWDLPALEMHVREHQAQSKRCPDCGQTTRAAFPPQVRDAVQYGAGVLGLCVYLHVYQMLPFARTTQLLGDLFGQAPSQATLRRALEQAHVSLRSVEEKIHVALRQSPVVHLDETSLRIGAARQWLHSAGTKTLTLYRVHAKRGREAIDAMGVLPGYRGVAVHDAYVSYLSYPAKHALCNAHLLRDLVAVEEETGALWAPALRALLLEIREAAAVSRAGKEAALAPARVSAWRARYDDLLCQGRAAHPASPETGRSGRRKQSPAYNLVQRLARHAEKVLAFMYDLAVPFDNNQAERDLRMSKTQQKISGGFRTQHGAEVFCRIRSYVSTLRKQALPPLAALASLFDGQPLLPAFDT